jgi:hypothetical protein
MNRSSCALVLAAIVVLASGGCAPSPESPPADQARTLKPLAAHGSAPSGETASGLKYTVPPEWQAETPSSSMRRAQYRLPRAEGDPEDGELAVFFFQGQGGSVQANIDRWISQFTQADGSPAVDAARTAHRDAQGIPLTIVDVSGTYLAAAGPMLAEVQSKPGFRMLAAVAETSAGPWFFKLTGPAATIRKWEATFERFLDSIRP